MWTRSSQIYRRFGSEVRSWKCDASSSSRIRKVRQCPGDSRAEGIQTRQCGMVPRRAVRCTRPCHLPDGEPRSRIATFSRCRPATEYDDLGWKRGCRDRQAWLRRCRRRAAHGSARASGVGRLHGKGRSLTQPTMTVEIVAANLLDQDRRRSVTGYRLPLFTDPPLGGR